MNTIRLFLGVIVLIGLSAAQAATIGYIATDLADVTPGEDLWRYDYTVSGTSFLQAQFFDIYFTPALYKDLAAGPAPNADWDILILQQPNPVNLPPFDQGIYDAFALADGASLSGLFSVSFIYLGPGSPGAQPFGVFDSNASQLGTGFTTPSSAAVPEPTTAALFLIGPIAWAIHVRRRSAIRR